MELKSVTTVVLVKIAISVIVVVGDPAKLLRVPKIYNALITSKEKILPSEAYPASTGPIFQPIGLPGSPVVIQPKIITGATPDLFNVKEGDKVNVPHEASAKSKASQPFTFFPRYSVYYPNPHLLFHDPFAYAPQEEPTLTPSFQISSTNDDHLVESQLENEEEKDLTYQRSKHKPIKPASITATDFPHLREYVKNNRPLDPNIPDIPPPPPPIRYKGYE